MLTTERILLFFLLVECQHVILYPIDQYFEGYYDCYKGMPSFKCRSVCANKSMDTLCAKNGNCYCRFKEIIAEHTCDGDVPTGECKAECDKRNQEPYCSIFNKFCYCKPKNGVEHLLRATLTASEYERHPIPLQWHYFFMNVVLVYITVICLYFCCRQITLKKVFR